MSKRARKQFFFVFRISYFSQAGVQFVSTVEASLEKQLVDIAIRVRHQSMFSYIFGSGVEDAVKERAKGQKNEKTMKTVDLWAGVSF